MPVVSILIPAYEPKADHLLQAIESVFAQTEKDWSLLIHDDCSVVDVKSIVAPYLSDPRVTFVRSERRLGIGGNWNACLRLARSPVLQFLFQDDAWEPDYLAVGLQALADNPSAGMVSIGYHYDMEGDIDSQAYYAEVRRLKEPYLKPNLQNGHEALRAWLRRGLHPCIPGEPSMVMLRKSVADNAGWFSEDMVQFLDAEYWARMLLHGDWICVPGDHGFFRVHGGSATARHNREGLGLYDRLRTLERLRPNLPSDLRKELDTSLVASLAVMIRKFFRRKKEGKGVSASGSGAVVSFALRHPFLLVQALVATVRG